MVYIEVVGIPNEFANGIVPSISRSRYLVQYTQHTTQILRSTIYHYPRRVIYSLTLAHRRTTVGSDEPFCCVGRCSPKSTGHQEVFEVAQTK